MIQKSHSQEFTQLSWKIPGHMKACTQMLPAPLFKTAPGVSSPGDPVVRTLHFTAEGAGLIPGQATRVPQAKGHGQKKQNNCPKLEATKTSFSRWTDNCGTTDNGMLLRVKRKWGSSHEKTRRNLKCKLLSDRNQSERATHCGIPATWPLGLRRQPEHERSPGAQGMGE